MAADSRKETLTAGFIAIGDELLDGIVLETNCHWMKQRLVVLGVENRRLVSVRDEVEEISKDEGSQDCSGQDPSPYGHDSTGEDVAY